MSSNQKRRGKEYRTWFNERAKYHEEGQYFIIPCTIWKSPLFRILPVGAKVVYVEFRSLCFKDREHIKYSYKDARELNLGHKTFSNALEILEDNGFIECVEQGGLYNNPSIYRLDTEWYGKNLEYLSNPQKYLTEHFPNKLKRKEIVKFARACKLNKNNNRNMKILLNQEELETCIQMV